MKIQNPENTALLLDLDGTLIDSSDKLAYDVQGAFARLGKSIAFEEAKRLKDWGLAAAEYGFLHAQFWDAFDHREPWEESLQKGKVRIYDDSIPTLEALTSEGYGKLALVTRSGVPETEAKIDFFDLRKYFRTVQITPPDRRRSPTKVSEALRAVSKFAIPVYNLDVVIVGDSEVDDIGTAWDLKRSLPSVAGVYVNREGTPLKHYKAEYEIQSLAQLLDVLKGGKK